MTGGERRRKWIRGCPAQRGGMHGPAAAGWIRRLGVEMGPGEPADTSGMKDETRSRRRCTECRRWYEPAASGVHNQKICGTASCRRGRRSRMARRRRERDIREYRVDERERQARRRAKRPTTASSTPGVTRRPSGTSRCTGAGCARKVGQADAGVTRRPAAGNPRGAWECGSKRGTDSGRAVTLSRAGLDAQVT